MSNAYRKHNASEPAGARSLLALSLSTLRRNVHLIWETNDTPLHILLPICRAIENPDQLGAIEASSPHLRGHTGELWLKLMKRNIANWDKFLLRDKKHSDGRNWTELEVSQKATYRTYQSTLRKARAAEHEADAQLRQAMLRQAAEQRSRETRIVERLPPVGAAQRRAAGLGDKYEGFSRNGADGALTFAGGSRTKTTTARGVMTKIQRELREQRLMKKGGVLSTPSHLLMQRAQFLPQAQDKRTETAGPKMIRRPGKPISTLRAPSVSSSSAARTIATTPVRKASSAREPAAAQQTSSPPAAVKKRTSVQAGLDEDKPVVSPAKLKTGPPPPNRLQQRKRPEATYLIPSRRKR